MDKVLDDQIALSFDPGQLELILLPTERCNFRCTYCYQDFIHGKMERRVVEAIKALLYARTDDVHSLHLSWFGGEPLIAKDIVLEINNFAKHVYCGKDYFASISTNGYFLTPELFGALIASGMRHFQISIDGLREAHDLSRRTIHGQGTFDVIWQNLLESRKAQGDFIITLRVHISQQNYESVIALTDQIALHFSGDPRFKVFLKEIVKLGGANDSQIVLLSRECVGDIVSRIREKCDGLIHLDVDDERDVHVCYASRLNSLLIRSDGRIGKCTVALNDDDNIVGALKDDGSMTLDRGKLMAWASGLFTRNPEQLGCPLAFKNRATQ